MLKIIFLFLISLHSFSQNTSVDDVLQQIYGNRCGSQEWISFALQDSQNLITTIESIKEKSSCQSAASALSGLKNLDKKMQELQAQLESQGSLNQLNSSQNQLFSLYQSTPDQGLKDALLPLLYQNEISRVSYQSEIDNLLNSRPSQVSRISSEILTSTNALFSQLTQNSQCLNQEPSVAGSAFSLITSISSSLAIVNPALSIALSATTQLTGEFVSHFRKLKLNKKINRIRNKTTRRNLFRCAMESLNSNFCKIRDARELLNLRKNAREKRKDIAHTSIEESFLFYEEAYPAIVNWLSEVRSGTNPTNINEARRQERAINRETSVITSEKKGIGLIQEAKEIANNFNANDSNYKTLLYRNIINLIKGLSYLGGSSSFGNPITELYPSRTFGYDVLGILPFKFEDQDEGLKVISFNNYDVINNDEHIKHFESLFKPTQDSFQIIIDNYKNMIATTLSQVQAELSRVTKPDPTLIFENVYRQENGRVFTAYRAIEHIIKYLSKNQINRGESNTPIRLFQTTITSLKDLKDNIDLAINYEVKETNTKDNKVALTPSQILSQIYRNLKLSSGTAIIEERLQTLFRMVFKKQLENLEGEDRDLVTRFLAENKFTEALSQAKQKTIFSNLVAIDEAESIAVVNTNQFINFFSKNISKVLNELNLEKQEIIKRIQLNSKLESNNEKLQENLKLFKKDLYRRDQEIAKYCFLILSASSWPKHISPKLCVGTNINSRSNSESAPQLEPFKESMITIPDESKQCMYFDYKRKMDVYLDWKDHFNSHEL